MSERVTKAKVLIVEDEAPMRKFMRVAFAAQGYEVLETASGTEALTLVAMHNPDALLLDLGLPDLDGLEVVKRLREWSEVPIIVVSARGQEKDKIDALDFGADDYLTKPFSVGELLARLRVALRRTQPRLSEPTSLFQAGDLTVDLAKRQVLLAATEIHLTPIEYKLLTTLVRHAGLVVTHRQLLKETWGAAYVEHSHYLRVYMSQLRHKLEPDPARPQLILNEPGVGYRLHQA